MNVLYNRYYMTDIQGLRTSGLPPECTSMPPLLFCCKWHNSKVPLPSFPISIPVDSPRKNEHLEQWGLLLSVQSIPGPALFSILQLSNWPWAAHFKISIQARWFKMEYQSILAWWYSSSFSITKWTVAEPWIPKTGHLFRQMPLVYHSC